jgi:hypothetical protein
VVLSHLVGLGAQLLPADVPLDPDADEARELLIEELARPEYQSAKPTWFDQLIRNFVEWLSGLTAPSGNGSPPVVGLLILLGVIVVLLALAFLIFGLPRLNRRSSVSGVLFGEDDSRTAAAMRAAAEAAAAAGDYSLATAEMFRSIARGLAERTILTTSPGTTAHDFGRRSARAFPDQSSAIEDAAAAFDEVRYLDRQGTQSRYASVAALERTLRIARPVLEAVSS